MQSVCFLSAFLLALTLINTSTIIGDLREYCWGVLLSGVLEEKDPLFWASINYCFLFIIFT